MAISKVAQQKEDSVAKRKEDLLQLLSDESDDKARTIVLVGESGIGKTWMAREISYCAIREGFFHIAIWVFWNREYDSGEEMSDHALRESIARQLSLLPTTGEAEVKDEREKPEEEKQKDLQKKISETVARKRVLLILDDVQKNEQPIISKLVTLLERKKESPYDYKVLITTRNSLSGDTVRSEIEMAPLSAADSLVLLKQRAGKTVFQYPGIEDLAKAFLEKFITLPGAIVLMAKAFSYFGKHDSGVQTLEQSLKEASKDEIYSIKQLLSIGYDLLPYSVLIDCCRGGSRFFCDRGSIHYNELIAYWIMEGYLGHVDCIEKAYERGHHVFMELIDCQILKKVEADYVTTERTIMSLDGIVMKGAMVNLVDCQRRGFGGTSTLGLANVFTTRDEWEGFGRITLTDGMIKTLCSGKKGQKLSTLLLDGNSLGKEDPCSIFQSEQELQVLALFNSTLKLLPHTLSDMPELLVLVLRGCGFLNKIEQPPVLKRLTVLEISGASSLKEIPDLFEHMTQLRSLNLSALQIEYLPPTLYKNLTELNWLILRDCSRLKTLKRLNQLKKLMVLDLSGAISLAKLDDGSFGENGKLQMLNFSKTKIKSLPFINSLSKLTHLLLSGCQELVRLPCINAVTSLQILDLSDASRFIEFQDRSLEASVSLKILDLSGTAADHGRPDDNLKPSEVLSFVAALGVLEALDLSKTQVETLPPLSKLVNLRRLLVSSCLKLEKLPDLNLLKKLEVLDLSGCISLKVIPLESFEQMSHLLRLDLSETKVERLPSLSKLSNLRHLLLKKCTNLKLPALESLSKLEELNLCGISSLEGKNGADFLEHMSHLHILDLSETQLEQLPSMSHLKNLCHLYLRDCPKLKAVPDLDAMTKLEVLDLSGTAISTLPNIDNFSNLRQLLLRDCPCLQEFLQQNVLHLLGGTVEELPYGISKLTHLEHLDLRNLKNTQGADSRTIMSTPEEPNQCQWSISGLPAETVNGGNKRPIAVSSTQFQLLEKTSLWETSFKGFDFSIRPVQEQSKKEVSFYRDHFVFRDIYFQSKHCFKLEEQQSLEICGFHCAPKGIGIDCAPKNIEDVLTHANYVFLIDNAFSKCLPHLASSNLEAMKGCWIERCTELESVKDIAELGKKLEILVLNAVDLKTLYDGNLQCEVFQNLTHLFLDCCPNLSTVFSSSQIPKTLKVLEIKFCDELKTLFQPTPSEPELPILLPILETLLLWELPELTSIGCTLPSLQTLKVWGCPKLKELEEHVKLATSLQHLWISNVTDLKSIYSGNSQPESFGNLKSLTLESCPMLVNVISSSQPPQSLEILKIKSCDKLKIVFEHELSEDYTLPLRTWHLHELPKLERIGAKLQETPQAAA